MIYLERGLVGDFVMLLNLISAVTKRLNGVFNIDVISTDVTVIKEKPCFIIGVEKYHKTALTDRVFEFNCTFTISYVADDRQNNQINLYSVIEKLNNVFVNRNIVIQDNICCLVDINDTDVGDDYVTMSCSSIFNALLVGEERNKHIMTKLHINHD